MDSQSDIFDDDGGLDTEKATELFAKEIHARAALIDPANEADWHSLTLGWALGKGARPDDAFAFATYIRYDTDLG